MDFELEMRVLTLDMGVVEWCGRELEMKAREFDPELVVAIARGGVTLAKYMFEDVPHLDVDIHRLDGMEAQDAFDNAFDAFSASMDRR